MAPPDTTAISVRVLLGTMLGLATISVALRFFSRRRQKARLLADDWLTVPVLVGHSLASATSCNHSSLYNQKFVTLPNKLLLLDRVHRWISLFLP
jgi:hypothetical protein